ncbi:MAG: exonuclease domain-containing protein [Clostridia bacterium]|nr:exonuclease domain-containing protein [Clostridia bacterium]
MSRYLVIDLEMCKVPKSRKKFYGCANEIIEIGAVLIDENLEISDSFKTYVSPEFGVIDSYIHNLTGISKNDVTGAPKVREALGMLIEWMPHDAILVTWSENDEKQISIETERKGIEIPEMASFWQNAEDCQLIFSSRMDSPKVYGLKEALIIADIFYDEHIHDAYADAYNTALLFIKLKKEKKLELNPYYSGKTASKHSYNPFADLLAGYKWVV